MMRLGIAALALTASRAAPDSAPLSDQQQPLYDGPTFDLIKELKQAEIIPTVFDEFKPFLTLNVTWKKASARVGNIVKPKKLQNVPYVELLGALPAIVTSDDEDNKLPQLTVVLTDPDAKSRDDPKWSQMCHWIVTDVPLTDHFDAQYGTRESFLASLELNKAAPYDIIPYKAPGPPPKTGLHRYVFAALAPKNGTTEKLYLSKPKDRQHWGYGEVRAGVREWAQENGLEVVGANFVYAQDEKQ